MALCQPFPDYCDSLWSRLTIIASFFFFFFFLLIALFIKLAMYHKTRPFTWNFNIVNICKFSCRICPLCTSAQIFLKQSQPKSLSIKQVQHIFGSSAKFLRTSEIKMLEMASSGSFIFFINNPRLNLFLPKRLFWKDLSSGRSRDPPFYTKLQSWILPPPPRGAFFKQKVISSNRLDKCQADFKISNTFLRQIKGLWRALYRWNISLDIKNFLIK